MKIPSGSEVTKMVVEVESWSHGCNHCDKKLETPELLQKVQNTIEDLILVYFEGLFKLCVRTKLFLSCFWISPFSFSSRPGWSSCRQMEMPSW